MNYAANSQRDAITQAMMNIQNPPPSPQMPQAPRIMRAQMTPQMTQPAPAAPQAMPPQMGGGDNFGMGMQRPQMPIGPPAPPPPQMPMDQSMGPPVADQAAYPPMGG